MIQVNLMHILVTSTLFIYIGHKRRETPLSAYTALGVLAIMIPFIVRNPFSKSLNEYTQKVNAFHYLLTMPVLLYVAYLKNKNSDSTYTLLKASGIFLAFLHGYILVSK